MGPFFLNVMKTNDRIAKADQITNEEIAGEQVKPVLLYMYTKF